MGSPINVWCALKRLSSATVGRNVLWILAETDGLVVFKSSVCCAQSLQLCPTLCNPMDLSLPGSSVHGILQARILEWVAIFFSRQSSWPRDRTRVSWIADGFFTPEPPGKPLHTDTHTHTHTQLFNINNSYSVGIITNSTEKKTECSNIM